MQKIDKNMQNYKKAGMNSQEPQIETFGCRLNIHESEVMREHAKAAGLKDTIIFNTCAVTKEAERQARQAIRRARRDNPGAKIVVTGCSAQIAPDMYSKMPEVDQIIGNDLKLQKDIWAQLPPLPNPPPAGGREEALSAAGGGGSLDGKVLLNDIMEVKETAAHLIEGFEEHTRAFLQVQNGCDHRCTFCIIPYGRGNSRSVPVGVIAEQARTLARQGYKEIVLTGVDITSYGPDLPGKPALGQMIRRVLALVPELPRLRLSSLDPAEIDADLWRLIAEEPRLMPHLHLSVQAGDDMILKRMKRRHLRQDVIDVCKRARAYRPDMSFGADLIAGFPTETNEMFENTVNLVEECGLTFLHVFPYSARSGTPAARMPQVEKKLRKDRARQLRKSGEEQVRKLLTRSLNRPSKVLVEKDNTGRLENYAQVRISGANRTGEIITVNPSKIEGQMLIAEVRG